MTPYPVNITRAETQYQLEWFSFADVVCTATFFFQGVHEERSAGAVPHPGDLVGTDAKPFQDRVARHIADAREFPSPPSVRLGPINTIVECERPNRVILTDRIQLVSPDSTAMG
jgi:hypothetical protein